MFFERISALATRGRGEVWIHFVKSVHSNVVQDKTLTSYDTILVLICCLERILPSNAEPGLMRRIGACALRLHGRPSRSLAQWPRGLCHNTEDRKALQDDATVQQLWAACDSTTRYQLKVVTAETAALGMAVGMVVPVLPYFAEGIGGVGATGVGLIVAVPSLATLLLNVPCGRLSVGVLCDTKGRVPMMVGGSALTSIGNVLTGLSISMFHLLPARLLVGVGGAAATPASEAYVADITARFPAHRGTMMGLLGGVGTLSYAMGPALGGFVAEALGPAAPFLCLGAATGLCAIMLSGLPETVSKLSAKDHKGAWAIAKDLLGMRDVQAVLAMDCALYTGWAVYLGVVPLHAVAVWGATAGQLGALYSMMAIAGCIGSPLGGWAGDKFGRQNVIVAGSVTCAIATGSLAFANDFTSFVGCLVLWDFAEGVLGTSMAAFAADVAPTHQRGQTFALRSQMRAATMLTMPIVVGVVGDAISLNVALGLGSFVFLGSCATFCSKTTQT